MTLLGGFHFRVAGLELRVQDARWGDRSYVPGRAGGTLIPTLIPTLILVPARIGTREAE